MTISPQRIPKDLKSIYPIYSFEGLTKKAETMAKSQAAIRTGSSFFNSFIMYPTKEYIEIMSPWKQKPEQFDQMINEKCNKKLKIIPSDFV